MTFFSTSKLLEIGEIPFISHVEKPTRKEALEYYRRLQQSYHIEINLYEEVQKMERLPSENYQISTSKGIYQTPSVIVATGFYDTPRLLNVPGEKLPKVKHYYDDAHPYIGQKLLIVGAANSACDVALEAWNKGAEVTMAIRKDEIYPKVKYWIRPNIENRIKEGSITANDFVLAMTGYKPNYTLLENLGLDIPDDEARIPIHDPETLETSLPGVYLAGVVCAGMRTSKLFIENTRDHGDVIIEHIQKRAVSTAV